ncbi:DUF4192 domain-containing protein [Pengzhenrongella frigida]|uniref:DUF4192 domain-containing protein n=1 Tax=Pengzhenrongella frigida TaxID=1259133 RepID=A0A4Q5MXH3_9MICO|nr:DUF4192 domain-containing protein [Cellulomonas sp. HLT2-17]RYV50330.1 DUF4192 domain-containing protein [Cellulomonas sp. HLT2-17]
MDATTIRVREPRELLALLPHQLGFRPQESAVAVSLRHPRGRVGLIARVDLDDLGDVVGGPQLARGLVSHLVSDGAIRAVLVLYTAEDPRYPAAGRPWAAGSGVPRRATLARAAAEQFRESAVPFLPDVAVWVVARSGYLSLDCADEACCPPGGRPLRDLDETMVSAHMVLAGSLVADSRDDLARISPAAAQARHNTARVAQRSRARRVEARAAGAWAEHRWRAEGLASWRDAMERSLAGVAGAPPAVLGRIEAALTDVRVRDAVLLALVPGTGDLPERTLVGPTERAVGEVAASTSDALGVILDPHRGVPPDDELVTAGVDVLERVVAHTRTPDQAAALTLLALIAWWRADGARAGVLLDRALGVDPDHRLARLLNDAVTRGLSPGWMRKPA